MDDELKTDELHAAIIIDLQDAIAKLERQIRVSGYSPARAMALASYKDGLARYISD